MPWEANKCGLDGHVFRGSVDIQTHGFIADAAIASGQRKRVLDMFGSGRDIEQQSRFPWVCLLSEVQPEFTISERLCGIFKQLALRQGGNASLTIINVAFRDAGPR